jgi:hypothetical protein
MSPGAATSVDHYDRLLAEHCTWMPGGDVHEVADQQVALLAELGLAANEGHGAAVDLGCGSGAQTLALPGRTAPGSNGRAATPNCDSRPPGWSHSAERRDWTSTTTTRTPRGCGSSTP